MADNTNLGSAGGPAIDDDPFAELTRIMGFDPREPVKPAAASPLAMSRITAIEPEPIQEPIPDLAIDLERELMGDFQDDEDLAEEELRPTSVDAASGDIVATAAADLDEGQIVEAARASSWFRPDESEAEHSIRIEPEFDGQADSAVEMPVAEARHAVELPLAEAEMFADAEPTQPETFEAEESATVVSAPAWNAVDDVAPKVAADHVGTTDIAEPEGLVEAREPWFEPEVSGFDDWADEPVEAAARSDDIDLSEVPGTAAQADEAGYEIEFDMPPVEAALAAPVELIAEEDNDEAPIGVLSPQADHDHDQAVAAARAYLARQAMAREADASVSAEEPDASHAAAAPAEALEVSLEEELNALLGNMPVVAKSPAITEAATAVSRSHSVAVADAPTDPEIEVPEQGAAGYADQAAPLAAESLSIDDDLDGLFDNDDFDAAISSGVEQASMGTARSEPAIAKATRNDLEGSMARSGHDPYAALSALSAGLKSSQGRSDVAASPVHASAAAQHAAYQREQMPEIETVDVPEPAIALADDLDLPDVTFEPEPRAISPFDDIDTEFSNLLNTMAAPAAATVAHPAVLDTRYRGYATPVPASSVAAPTTPRNMPQAEDAAYPVYSDQAKPIDLGTVSRSGQTSNLADMEFAYDPDVGEEMARPSYGVVDEPKSKWRRYGIIAAVGGMALVGALGAYAVSFDGNSGSQEVALVKADPSPVKVKPENPGGATVANQDSTVYDSARGEADTTPTQEKLLTSAEEPAQMPMAEDEAQVPMMGADDVADAEAGADEPDTAGLPLKDDDRLAEQDADSAGVDSSVEVSAVAPRKVRTMIVKADGTLVAREAAAVDAVAEGAVDPMASNAVPDRDETTATVSTAESAASAADQETAAVAQPSESAGTPQTAPIAPARPADQPVNIVGKSLADQQEQQVASIEPTAAEPVALPAGTYSMQIASQPTQESAQASFNSLSRKYASVLDGHQARIVEADIAGKGKYWRVQVPVGSRKDAIKLCESYKSAGGSCFVSK